MKTRELDKLKKKLPRGWRMQLWRRVGKYSLSAIDAVMRGDYNNDIIIEGAIDLAAEHQGKLKERAEKINSL